MGFLLMFVLGTVFGFFLRGFIPQIHKIKNDAIVMTSGSHTLNIVEIADDVFHVVISEKLMLNDHKILDMHVSKATLYDVIQSAKNKGYIDEEAESLILAKYEG